MWSSTLMPKSFPLLTRRSVVSRSGPLGFAIPDGWLCYVQSRVMWRSVIVRRAGLAAARLLNLETISAPNSNARRRPDKGNL